MSNSTTFTDAVTPIKAAWLNDVNTDVYRTATKVADYVNPATATPAQTTAGINSAIAAAKAGNKMLWFEPGATYITTSTIELLGSSGQVGLSYFGNGCTIYRSTGAGVVLSADAGGSGSRCDNITIRDFKVRGNALSTYGFLTRGLARSDVSNIRAIDVATAGHLIQFSVCTKYSGLKMSNNIDTPTLAAATGLVVDDDGSGNYTADCIFENIVMEGTSAISGVGIDIIHAGLYTRFVNGTCEGLTMGMHHRSTANDVIVEGMDFEANSTYDILIEGQGFLWEDCNSTSASSSNTVSVSSTAKNTTFRGGYARWISLDPSSVGTRFIGCKVSDVASIGITGATSFSAPSTSIYQSYGVIKVDTNYNLTSYFTDNYAPQGTWTPSIISAGGGTQGTVTKAVGTYNKVGRLCYIQGQLIIAKGTLGAGAISVSGFPFNSRNVTDDLQYLNLGEWSSVNLGAGYTHLSLRFTPNSNTATFIKSGLSVVSAVVNLADFPDPMIFMFSGVYETV